MIDTNKYNRLKRQVDVAKTEKAKAEGALEASFAKMQEEFECRTIEDAEKLLRDLQSDQKKVEEQFNSALAEFEDEWGEEL